VSESVLPECTSKDLYDLFPTGPAKQACKVGGLPQPLGKGGY
jgi:tRNA 2-thiouridine synthesizing protein E